jgi:hypothetical protein
MMPAQDLILVTGATGNTGSTVNATNLNYPTLTPRSRRTAIRSR